MRTTEELDGYLLDIPQEKVCFIHHVHLYNTICTWHRAGFDMSYRFVSRMELARCPSKMTHRNIQVDSWAGALPACILSLVRTVGRHSPPEAGSRPRLGLCPRSTTPVLAVSYGSDQTALTGANGARSPREVGARQRDYVRALTGIP